MHDNWIIAAAMATAACGITMLLFALLFLEVPLATVQDAAAAGDGMPLRMQGVVRSVRSAGNSTVISIEQPVLFDVVVFAEANVSPGECVIVQGKRGSFNGKPQLNAGRVRRCI